ncbi:MAG TPA: alpha-glucan family phosphorylase, partial [Cytophagaceae bacterium]|nr:alpha-glucan family phosphorylase [Cytophagaceae bacterium]
VFTTHTPEKAGNEEISLKLLDEMSFFSGVPLEEVKKVSHIKDDTLNFTLAALNMSKIANGVSKIHGIVANTMWGGNDGICKIISITNAQNKKFWMDSELEHCLDMNDDAGLMKRKSQMKRNMLEIVADQTGKIMDENVLTIVWARRFASYKRADLIIKDLDRFLKLVTRAENSIQVIWAGKPYPEDYGAIDLFNQLIGITNDLPRCAVLVGYEMKLSSVLKKGADVWLNTPRFSREASGTSGMTAAMNGAVNFSIPDGWVPEFSQHGKNSFVIPVNPTASYPEQDNEDHSNMMNILEHEIIPVYYQEKNKWTGIVKSGMKDIIPVFDSDRMVREYYEKLYNY